jgi:hypothetical protein
VAENASWTQSFLEPSILRARFDDVASLTIQLAGGELAWARERPKARRENLLNDPNHPDHDLHLG